MDDDELSYSSHEDEPLSRLKQEEAPNKKLTPGVGESETRWVICSKTFVVIVLLASAGVISYLTFWFMSNEEQDNFESEFRFDAIDVLDFCQATAFSLQRSIQSTSITYTSYANYANATFPNYTLPDFEQFASQAIESTGASSLVYSPLVSDGDRKGYEAYAVANTNWIASGFEFLGKSYSEPIVISEYIYTNSSSGKVSPPPPGPYCPIWQMFPPPEDYGVIQYDMFTDPRFQKVIDFVMETKLTAISEVMNTESLEGMDVFDNGEPQSLVVTPVFQEFDDDTIVGFTIMVFPWIVFFKDVLPDEDSILDCVLKDTCGSAYTYQMQGGKPSEFRGIGDLHEVKYNYLKVQSEVISYEGLNTSDFNLCQYIIEVYPTSAMEEAHSSNLPIIFTVVVLGIFFFASTVFGLYDVFVMKRQRVVLDTAMRAMSIVTSLFPGNVADQLAQDKAEQEKKKKDAKVLARRRAKQQLAGNFFGDDETNDPYADLQDDDILIESKPIADLFPSATVLFADIAGFTAWSSIREPSQVFILLENIYRNFDKIAVQRRIFKVETIGDCYVAVCGLPEPNKEHAVAMAKFSRDCMEKMDTLVHKLEAKLGPDTGDLSMRFGMHSGPVTAGVLRGDRARFQLFGDTVNTAARMESTGLRDRIHISQETADLLIAAGKSHWVVPREDVVVAKGKGELRTFWLLPREDTMAPHKPSSDVGADQLPVAEEAPQPVEEVQQTQVRSDKIQRMIDWNCDILLQLLRLIVAKRQASRRESIKNSGGVTANNILDLLESDVSSSKLPIDEIVEVIELPSYDSAAYEKDPRFVEISQTVEAQLHSFVTVIASMYHDTPFHNFEHASHVSMSTVKLLSRIVAPTQPMKKLEGGVAGEVLHDHTYGITSDPLTQFAVVLSALIHDADHRGVPNFILAEEDKRLATFYQNRSIAEQNSIDVAWEVLMEVQYKQLRRTIYTTTDELKRFRQLVVNTVMATDIFDKGLAAIRKSRWDKAFGGVDDISQESVNRKATVVMEHLIQASDVSHTMQHWHVYTKWNERLYREMYAAYLSGRSSKDPTDGWYQGEIGFFDGWVIPLAKKLKECGVFGVSSDEYLNYAEKNRAEWVVRGEDVLETFKNRAASKRIKGISRESGQPIQNVGSRDSLSNGMKKSSFTGMQSGSNIPGASASETSPPVASSTVETQSPTGVPHISPESSKALPESELANL